jgi:hypothetical protein
MTKGRMVPWRHIIPVIACLFAGCGARSAATPPTTDARPTSPPPTDVKTAIAPILKPAAPPLVIAVTGTGPALSITLHIDNRRHGHGGPIRLPYTYVDTNYDDIDGAYPVTAVARDGSGSATARITCQIVESGADVARVTAKGPHAVVSCSDHQPQNPLRPPAAT